MNFHTMYFLASNSKYLSRYTTIFLNMDRVEYWECCVLEKGKTKQVERCLSRGLQCPCTYMSNIQAKIGRYEISDHVIFNY